MAASASSSRGVDPTTSHPARHPGAIQFRIVDAASLEGVFKTLRYRLRAFPAVVIGGRERIVGDLDAGTEAVERHLRARSGHR